MTSQQRDYVFKKTENKIDYVFIKIIVANPGFYVLDILTGDDTVEPIQYPVIAWALEDGALAPYPITQEGIQLQNVYILQPHGTVERACIDGYPSVGDWLDAQKKEFIAKKGRSE